MSGLSQGHTDAGDVCGQLKELYKISYSLLTVRDGHGRWCVLCNHHLSDAGEGRQDRQTQLSVIQFGGWGGSLVHYRQVTLGASDSLYVLVT